MAKILVVDDNADVGRIIVSFLESSGHTVIFENLSERVINRIWDKSFDLIISDLFMPDFDGLEVVMKVREVDQKIPILIVTGGSRFFPSGTDALEGITSSAELFGASAVLAKPFRKAHLLEAVDRLV